MRRLCHNQSVEISVETQKFCRILDVTYLLLFFSCKLQDLILSFTQKNILFSDHSE